MHIIISNLPESTNVMAGEGLLHQARPKLKSLPFPGRCESTLKPVDGHLPKGRLLKFGKTYADYSKPAPRMFLDVSRIYVSRYRKRRLLSNFRSLSNLSVQISVIKLKDRWTVIPELRR